MQLEGRRTKLAAIALAAVVGIGAARALFVAGPAHAQSPNYRNVFAVSGPLSIGRNQHLRTTILLPAVQRTLDPAGKFRLYLRDLKGHVISSNSFVVGSSLGARIDLVAFGDGSVRIVEADGSVRKLDMTIGENDNVELTGILIGLLRIGTSTTELPAVQHPVATFQLGTSRELSAVGPASVALPYVEQ